MVGSGLALGSSRVGFGSGSSRARSALSSSGSGSGYARVVSRIVTKHLVRLAVIAGLTAISIALITGIGLLAPTIRQSLEMFIADGAPPQLTSYIGFIADGVERIAAIFPTLFSAVVALVVYMTITRLVESERAQIGTLASLGYSRHHIVAGYLPFTLLSCLVGGALGLALGYFVVSPILFDIIQDTFALPDAGHVTPWVGIFTALGLVVAMLGVTVVAAGATARTKPTLLFTPKTPPAGKPLFLERFPKLWNRLAYRHKSTIRNIVRYRIRFFLTVISMGLATLIVYAGLSLSSALNDSNPELTDTIGPISALLVIAAIIINTLVVYNITNINIEERVREIATLKVLGYRPLEVAGYVFREIAWLAIFGMLFGLPAGFAMMFWIFDYLQFGGMEFVSWWVWPATLGFALASLLLADVLLYRRLVNTDMNGSLKSIE
ncbi:MAG: FtsX-like permease family protein [Cellulomonadaceae bacterium]|jgi:hypothetical protein|nr:FtsX-like permease family protein [Cellulomonadaceae bacterium]